MRDQGRPILRPREDSAVRLTAHRPRVLIIDDSDSARESIRQLLTGAGFEAFCLPSAIGATRLILRESIVVVIVDLSMPGLSGDRLVGVLRRNPRLRDLLIVVVSGQHQHELLQVAEQLEVQGVMAKDCLQQELVPLLQRLVHSNRGLRALSSGLG